MNTPPIALSVTHYNRFPMLVDCLAYPLEEPRIGEVVVVDDASTDGSWEKIQAKYAAHSKVRLFRNGKNLDCYANKAQALRHTLSPWSILFDSDNILGKAYLDALFALPAWDPAVLYCPVYAHPHFDYRAFSGVTVDHTNAAQYAKNKAGFVNVRHPRTGRLVYQGRRDRQAELFRCALNTANYFVHRDSYLAVWDAAVDPHTADSIYQASNWLASGRRLYFVPGLQYFHRIHEGSHYKQNRHKTGKFLEQVERRIVELV